MVAGSLLDSDWKVDLASIWIRIDSDFRVIFGSLRELTMIQLFGKQGAGRKEGSDHQHR